MDKKEAILIGMLPFVLLICASSVAHAAPVVVSVSPPSTSTSQGQLFTVDITIDPRGAEVFGAQYDLYFDSSVLTVVSQTQGTFLSQDGARTNVFVNETNNTIGKVKYGEGRIGIANGVSSPGVLASLSFKAIRSSGTSNLILSTVKVSDAAGNKIEVEVKDGTCTVGTGTGEPAFTDTKVEEAHKLMEVNPEAIILLDVRSAEEHEAEYISMPQVELKNIPADELENRLGELDKTKKLIVYDRTGVRSKEASGVLVRHGYQQVYNLLGGLDAWRINFREAIIKATPSPALTATPPPTVTVSPSSPPAPLTPTPRISGFEAFFALTMLAVSSLLTRRKE
ncbi:MAG: hypothetical protein EFT35_01735 [Methanophagales archaeon ANME-1-THS]|nr:MAG: hypothetical protein EFT35_01735 [Methanophagales archaeon ANME-1-THS]